MPAKKYVIRLSVEERAALEKVSASNHRSIREKLRARVLLLSDQNVAHESGGSRKDDEIANGLKLSLLSIGNIRQRASERGALASIQRAEQTSRKARKLDGIQEAHLVTIVCSTPPEGSASWSLRLIRDRLIELEIVEHIGLETIRTTLKKINSGRG